MIKKPELTENQKASFEKSFRDIMDEAPKELQDYWDKRITWALDMPIFQKDILNKLPTRLKDKYVGLSNKIKGRNI